MTIPLGGQNDDIHALMFRFLGAFAHVQNFIDESLTKTFLEKRIPNAASFFWDGAVSRIRDSDRPKLVQRIASDISSDADLSCFNTIYADVKRLRDRSAHAARIEVQSQDEVRITPSIVMSGPSPELEWTTVTRLELVDALKRCAWLEAQIQYAMYSGDLIKQVYLGGQQVEVVKPTRHPKDWGEVVLRPLNGNR
ncbi:hypothetical protein [Prescottella equi]|uniref:hypothetical protein n=1 Tax=Rhodococcus hoagii TaxID=43767 RepID=UPI000A0F7C71|nr:hypothetical protein [Prescottella equi]ORM04569.1 hypothetical protein A5N73_08005 [Prescottella equi]